MKLLLIIITIFSTNTFASSPLAPKEISKIEKFSQEETLNNFTATFKASLEKKPYLIEKFYRLCNIHSLECLTEEAILDSSSVTLKLKIKKQLNMNGTIEELLNTL